MNNPILYDGNETTFTTLGIGVLSDCITVRVRRVLNGKDELEVTYPTDGERYSELKNDRVILAVPEYKKDAQPYRIYQITKPMKGSVKIYARHISEQKNFIPIMPFTASSLAETLTKISSYAAESSPFTFWTNKSVSSAFKLTAPASLGNVLGGMAGSILDTYGGEYEFDKYQVKLWNRRGVDRGVSIRYGKNLTKLEQKETLGDTVTGVCPFYKSFEGDTIVTLPEKVVESQYANLYAYKRTITKDFSEVFESVPTEAQLRAAAQSYISGAGIGQPQVSLDVSFEHLAQYKEYENIGLLETINLGDTVHIDYAKLGISATARVVETDYDVLRERYNSVKVGRVKASLTQTIRDISATAEKSADVAGNIGAAISSAIATESAKITGVNGGYIRTNRDADGEPYEVLIMNTPDVTTATNVIRINQEGVAFSTNGYEGPFNAAFTIDGHIVANYVDTGILTANIIRAGILADITGTNFWNLDTGELHLEAVSSIEQKLRNIGGRNILLESATKHFIRYGGGTLDITDNVFVDEWACDDAHRAVGTGGNSTTALLMIGTSQTTPAYLSGQKYVLSIYLKNNDSKNLIAGVNGTNDRETIAPGEAKRMVRYITGNGTTSIQFQIFVANVGDSYDFTWWHPKIEYGEVPTSWTPAPEDMATASDVSASIEILAGDIRSTVNRVTSLEGDVQTRISTAVEQSEASLGIRIDRAENIAGQLTNTLDAHFDFSATGLQIRGTENSTAGSYLNLASDRMSLYSNNAERLWLTAEGANAQAFNAEESVSVGNFIWEQYPGGFRLRKRT